MSDSLPPPDVILRCYAKHLDLLRRRKLFARPSYDCMADALVWPDETTFDTPTRLIWSLRFLTHHRMGFILGEDRPYGELWGLGRELFPNWVGFHTSRCRFSARLARFYRGHSSSFNSDLEELCDDHNA